jgi:hypothetical protein
MKTFSEFIAEAEVRWNTGKLKGSGKSPADTAKQRMTKVTQSQRTASSAQQIAQTTQRLQRMKKGISTSDEIAKTQDPRPETTATRAQRTGTMRVNTGYASKSADTRGRSGSLSGIASPAGEGSGSRVAGRYGDLRKGSSNNIGSTQINTGRGYTGRKFGKGGNR